MISDIKEELFVTKESIKSNKTERSTSKKSLTKRIKNWIIILMLLFVAGSVVFTVSHILPDRVGKFETIAESTLNKILMIGELSTLEYVYNGVAAAYTDEKEEKIKYYVSYEGIVTISSSSNLFDVAENRAKELISNYIRRLGEMNDIEYEIEFI